MKIFGEIIKNRLEDTKEGWKIPRKVGRYQGRLQDTKEGCKIPRKVGRYQGRLEIERKWEKKVTEVEIVLTSFDRN